MCITNGVVGKKSVVTATDDAFEICPKGRKWRKNVIKRKVCLRRKNLHLFASEENVVGNLTS